MAENKPGEVESRLSFVNYIGLGILLICYVGALWNVYKIKEDEVFLKKKVIRICHWQLELGVKDALQKMADDYEKLHPDRKVIQLPVTERAYAQWATTQLIGRTAPDLVEQGFFDVKLYLGRYFQPITDELRQPNPYNKDNEFKDTPWMDTFNDGLQNSYIPELLDYYSVGFSQFTVRVFYNKTLYKKIIGTETPPKTLAELFGACDKILAYVKTRNADVDAFNNSQSKKKGFMAFFSKPLQKIKSSLVPIASSRYQVGHFKTRYGGMFSADRCQELDYGFDGNATSIDMIKALVSGDLKVQDEKYKIYNELVRKLSSYFNPGFMSIDRMDAGFSFVQGNAVMITSGSWDASSYEKKIKDQPFGDIIVSVDGKTVSNSADAVKYLDEARKNPGSPVHLLVEREGAQKKISLVPVKGADIWASIGVEIQDVQGSKGMVPVVADVDSASPAEQAGIAKRRTFEMGIFDFPMPTKDDPVYGKYVVGRVFESSSTSFPFGLTKFTQHKDECIDFLQFCTTPENNQKLNEIAQWIPAVKGAKPIKFLEPFAPNYDGYWGYLNFNTIGSKTDIKEKQIFWPYISGDTDYAKYIGVLSDDLPRTVAEDYVELLKKTKEAVPDKQVLRSQFLAQYLFPESFIDEKTDDVSNMPKALEKKRREAEIKFAASWDNLVGFALEEMRIRAMMQPCFKDRDRNAFSKAFFTELDRISGMSSAPKGNSK